MVKAFTGGDAISVAVSCTRDALNSNPWARLCWLPTTSPLCGARTTAFGGVCAWFRSHRLTLQKPTRAWLKTQSRVARYLAVGGRGCPVVAEAWRDSAGCAKGHHGIPFGVGHHQTFIDERGEVSDQASEGSQSDVQRIHRLVRLCRHPLSAQAGCIQPAVGGTRFRAQEDLFPECLAGRAPPSFRDRCCLFQRWR